MRFRYVALEADGREVRGLIEARSVREAVARLSSEGRIPVSTEPDTLGGGVAASTPGDKTRLKEKALPDFTRRLAQLTAAGVAVDKALEILAQNSSDDAARFLRARLDKGEKFSGALQKYGAPFDAVFVALVRAGEVAGDLSGALTNLAQSLEQAREVRSELISSLTYPILLLIVSVAVFFLLMLFVVPRFEVLFADAQTQLPLAAQIVIGLASAMKAFWWVPLVLFISAYFGLRSARRNEASARAIDAFILRMPIFGELLRRSEEARLSRALGALLASGAPAYNAMTLASKTLSNRAKISAAHSACERVRRGESLSRAISNEGLAEGDLVEIMQVGESAGDLGPALVRAASMIEDNLTRRLKAMVALVEPLIILTLGALIGGVVVSLFSAILSVNDLAF